MTLGTLPELFFSSFISAIRFFSVTSVAINPLDNLPVL
jgi:hypothetical protein